MFLIYCRQRKINFVPHRDSGQSNHAKIHQGYSYPRNGFKGIFLHILQDKKNHSKTDANKIKSFGMKYDRYHVMKNIFMIIVIKFKNREL